MNMQNRKGNTLFENAMRLINNKKGCLSTVPCGFSNIDESIHALQSGQFYVLAGAVAMGKTTFAGQLLLNASANVNVLNLQFLESEEKMTKRLLSIAGEIPYYVMESRSWSKQTEATMNEVIDQLKDQKLYIERCIDFTEEKLLGLIAFYVVKENVKLIVFDDEEHLWRCLPKKISAEEQYAFMLKLKLWLSRLDCCGVLLKKIDAAKRTQKNPYHLPSVKSLDNGYELSDIADHLWFFHRLEYFGIEKDEANNCTTRRIDLYVKDVEGGVLETLYFKFTKWYTSIEAFDVATLANEVEGECS